VDETKLYLKCEPYLKTLAYRYARKMPNKTVYDAEELIGIGSEVFMRCIRSFTSGDCQFSSYFWCCLENEYKNLLNRSFLEAKHSEASPESVTLPLSKPTESELHEHIVQKLSAQATRVFECLVNPQEKLTTRAIQVFKSRSRATGDQRKMKSVRITNRMIAKHLKIHPMQVTKSLNEVKRVLVNENIAIGV